MRRPGSQSYVPPDAKDDKALKTAADLLHGIKLHRDRAGNRRQGRASTSRPTNGEPVLII